MSTAAPDTPPQVQQMALADLGLKPGIALQVRRLVEGATKKEAQLFGAIKDRGVMVGPQGTEGEDPGMTEGDVCIVRGFTGQFEFSFVSKVIQTYEKPFVYALLVYPASVDARLVRQSMRTRGLSPRVWANSSRRACWSTSACRGPWFRRHRWSGPSARC